MDSLRALPFAKVCSSDMATNFLVDPDGSFLQVEPGTIMLVEPDPPVFAYKTVVVPRRVAPIAVHAREPVWAVASASRRVRVSGL
jgi:hypothetical protein